MQIDTKGIIELEKETIHKMDQIKSFIQEQAELAASYERQNHLYHNRSGDLERSTVAEITASNSGLFEISISMKMEYAEYIYNKGLTVIDAAIEMAKHNIESYVG